MDIRDKVRHGLKWSALSKLFSQLITWALTIYVMRLLSPEDYGLMAMATILTGFLALLKEFGLGPAIIQTKTLNETILRQIFGLLILANLFLFGFVYAIAPPFAAFFDQPELTEILRVLCFIFLLIPLESIPKALLQREMKFKQLAAVEFVSAVVGGLVTFFFAWNDYGVWSLVIGALARSLARTVLMNVFETWARLPLFSVSGLRSHISFGGLITIDQSLWYFYSKADTFIVGKVLGAQILGFYSVAMHLSSLPMQKLNSIINQVAFPAFSHIQEDRVKVTHYLTKAIRVLAFFAFPVFFGIAAVAEDAILFLLGEKWSNAVLPMIILSVVMPVRMISNIFPTVVRGCGRADISVINLLIACLIMPLSFLIGTQWGLEGVCYAWLIAYPIVFLIEVTRAKVVTNVSIIDIFSAIKQPFLLSLMMYILIQFISIKLSPFGYGASLTVEILTGVVFYLALLYFFCKAQVQEILRLAKS